MPCNSITLQLYFECLHSTKPLADDVLYFLAPAEFVLEKHFGTIGIYCLLLKGHGNKIPLTALRYAQILKCWSLIRITLNKYTAWTNFLSSEDDQRWGCRKNAIKIASEKKLAVRHCCACDKDMPTLWFRTCLRECVEAAISWSSDDKHSHHRAKHKLKTSSQTLGKYLRWLTYRVTATGNTLVTGFIYLSCHKG